MQKQPKIPEHIQALLKNSKDKSGIRLDLGCGRKKQPGFIGMDIMPIPGVEICHDLEEYPWPLPDKCATTVMASHIIEHINPARGGMIKFMDEVWRIMKPEGEFMISLPYGGSPGYWQDPTHCNGVTEVTFAYFDPLAASYAGDRLMNLYTLYEPAPWKIVKNEYNLLGNMEVLLIKREDDPSYHKYSDNKIHFR